MIQLQLSLQESISLDLSKVLKNEFHNHYIENKYEK